MSSRLSLSTDNSAPASGTLPPVTPVPAPAIVTGVADSEARRRNAIPAASSRGATISSAWPWNPEASSTRTTLHLEDHGHDQRAALGLLGDVALQIGADFLLHHAPIAHLFG